MESIATQLRISLERLKDEIRVADVLDDVVISLLLYLLLSWVLHPLVMRII